MEANINQERQLHGVLRGAASGKLATFATFQDKSFAERLENANGLADIRGRVIYGYGREINHELPSGINDTLSELGIDMSYSTDPADIAAPAGEVTPAILKNPVYGSLPVWQVKLAPEDADYLLGMLPDHLLKDKARPFGEQPS